MCLTTSYPKSTTSTRSKFLTLIHHTRRRHSLLRPVTWYVANGKVFHRRFQEMIILQSVEDILCSKFRPLITEYLLLLENGFSPPKIVLVARVRITESYLLVEILVNFEFYFTLNFAFNYDACFLL